MRRAGTSEDAYVTQNWRALRFGRCVVTLIRDELTATPSLRGAAWLMDQSRRPSLDVHHDVAHPAGIRIHPPPEAFSDGRAVLRWVGPFGLLPSPSHGELGARAQLASRPSAVAPRRCAFLLR